MKLGTSSTEPVAAATTNQTQPHLDATHRLSSGQRALVLHGGGSAGNAWEIGVIAGLFDAGLDVTEADVIIGTSAGSTVAAQITSGVSPSDLLASIVTAPGLPRAHSVPVGPDVAPNTPVVDHMEKTDAIIGGAHDAPDMRRRLGAAALKTDDPSSQFAQTQWRATVASRLPHHQWPQQSVLIVAVDAHTGEPVVFDRHSGVDLVDAVAASCANGFGVPPYGIGERRYIDGGYRRSENADLAIGYERVLVLSPFGGRSRMPVEWRMHLTAQIEDLRARGSSVETIFPDDDARRAFGDNMMDPSTRAPAARAGYEQGRTRGAGLREFWR